MRIKEHLILRRTGDKYLVIDPGKGVVDLAYVYALNQTAAELWEGLKGRDFSTETISELLVQMYEILPEKALDDAVCFIREMRANELLEESINKGRDE